MTLPPEKHSDVPGCVVRLTAAAIEDLERLFGTDPNIVRRCFKKLIVIERNPHAGEPLLGGLVGFRKITVGNRDWRIVWKVSDDQAGGLIVEVAEVWAVGYRKDGEVYDEITARSKAAGDSPATKALTDVLAMFEKQARDLTATPEPLESEETPRWLTDALVRVVRLRPEVVKAMSIDEADAAWTAYISGPGS